jgi:hypothetical protein
VTSTEVNLKGSARKPLSDHFGIRAYFSLQETNDRDGELSPKDRLRAIEALQESILILKKQTGPSWKVYQNLAEDLVEELRNSSHSDLESFLSRSQK